MIQLFQGGDDMAIIRNAIQCKKCGDIIESTSVHDFRTCSCGTCSVDGDIAILDDAQYLWMISLT